jgi:hypothetical protein
MNREIANRAEPGRSARSERDDHATQSAIPVQTQWERHEVVGQLQRQTRNQEKTPLPNLTVRAFDLDAKPRPRELGYDLTNEIGSFTIILTLPVVSEPRRIQRNQSQKRKLRFEISNQTGRQIARKEIVVQLDRREPVIIEVRVPKRRDTSPALKDLAENLRLKSEFLTLLQKKHRIRSLADVRKAGGICTLKGMQAHAEQAKLLEAHAVLDILTRDVKTNTELIRKNYISIAHIASVTRTKFIAEMGKKLGEEKAAQLHHVATAQNRFLDGIAASLIVEKTYGST